MDNLQIILSVQSASNSHEIKEGLTLLYENNSGLIGYCVRPYTTRPDYEDIRQEAFIALAQAAKDFDPTGAATFSGYAVKRIKWHLYRYFSHQTAAHIPQGTLEILSKYKALKRSGIKDGKICNMLKISRAKLEEIQKAEKAQTSTSLYTPVRDDTDITLADTITDDRDEITRIEEDIDRDGIRQTINAALDKIGGYPAMITRLFYFRGLKTSEICKRYNISYSTAMNYKAKALNKLSKIQEVKDLYIDMYYSNVYHDSYSHFAHTFSSLVEETAIKRILYQDHKRDATRA